jgi:hypothetical protein
MFRTHYPWVGTSIALLVAGIALLVALQPDSTVPTLSPSPTNTPIPNGAMWTLGTGGDGTNPYIEWVAIYPNSTLWDMLGAPSLHFTDHAPVDENRDRSFEIGFYKYGPTWHTENPIIEFWIGGRNAGGTLSIIGNNTSGGQLEVRNPTDTGHISLDYREANRPTISVDRSNPLFLEAKQGLVSVSEHTFRAGINIPASSGHSGQESGDGWKDGAITVASSAVNAESLVILTPTSRPRGQWWVADLVAGESFTVHSTASDEDMAFNWLIIN